MAHAILIYIAENIINHHSGLLISAYFDAINNNGKQTFCPGKIDFSY